MCSPYKWKNDGKVTDGNKIIFNGKHEKKRYDDSFIGRSHQYWHIDDDGRILSRATGDVIAATDFNNTAKESKIKSECERSTRMPESPLLLRTVLGG